MNVRLVHRVGWQHGHHPSVRDDHGHHYVEFDETCPTVLGGGVCGAAIHHHWLEIPMRLVHKCNEWTQHEPMDADGNHIISDDQPCPTVTGAGVCGVDHGKHWLEIDMTKVEVTYNGWDRKRGAAYDADGPAPTIVSDNRFIIADDGAEHSTAQDGKPPYTVPLMAEIAETRGTNGLTVVSTFSGCGGSCLGFEMAGFAVRYASEFIEAARDTYTLNHPGVPIDDRDIRHVHPEEILERAGLERGDVDVMEGSPPCASFSTAGKRNKKWGEESTYSDTRQRTDDLFFEFARLVDGVRPRTFVAENVSGLVKGVSKGYFKEILAKLRSLGYQVEARLLDAQWLGVPQQRQRIIFIGVRDDVGRPPAFPSPLPYRYSLAEALPWLSSAHLAAVGLGAYENRGNGPLPTRPSDEPCATVTASQNISGDSTYEVRIVHDTSGLYGSGDVTERPSPTISVGVNNVNSRHYQVHGTMLTHDPETGYRISLEGHAIGVEYDRLREGENSGKYLNLVRSASDQPGPTVTQAAGERGAAGVTHPVQRRKFTLLELRRICGFPDDFELTGTYQQRWERLGRAVPPLMMRAVAETLRDEVLT